MDVYWQTPKFQIPKCKVHPIKLYFVISSLIHTPSSIAVSARYTAVVRHWLLTVHCILAFTKITTIPLYPSSLLIASGTVIKVMYQLTWNIHTQQQTAATTTTTTSIKSRDMNREWVMRQRLYLTSHLNNKHTIYSMSIFLRYSKWDWSFVCRRLCVTITPHTILYSCYGDFFIQFFMRVNKTTIAILNCKRSNAI